MKNISHISLIIISGGGRNEEPFSAPVADNGRCSCVINPYINPIFKVVYLSNNAGACGVRCCDNHRGAAFLFSRRGIVEDCPNPPQGRFMGELPIDALL